MSKSETKVVNSNKAKGGRPVIIEKAEIEKAEIEKAEIEKAEIEKAEIEKAPTVNLEALKFIESLNYKNVTSKSTFSINLVNRDGSTKQIKYGTDVLQTYSFRDFKSWVNTNTAFIAGKDMAVEKFRIKLSYKDGDGKDHSLSMDFLGGRFSPSTRKLATQIFEYFLNGKHIRYLTENYGDLKSDTIAQIESSIVGNKNLTEILIAVHKFTNVSTKELHRLSSLIKGVFDEQLNFIGFADINVIETEPKTETEGRV